MAKFTVVRLKDAWVPYRTVVEADTAEEARERVHMAYAGYTDEMFTWEEGDLIEFDASLLGVEDMDGNEIIEPTEE